MLIRNQNICFSLAVFKEKKRDNGRKQNEEKEVNEENERGRKQMHGNITKFYFSVMSDQKKNTFKFPAFYTAY